MRQLTLTPETTESVSLSGSVGALARVSLGTANAAGSFTPIIRVTTPKSRYYTFRHLSDLVLKLFKAGPTELSPTSQLFFAVRRPTSRSPQDMTGVKTYAAWFNTPLSPGATGAKTQYDQETMANRRISFLSSSDIVLPQDHILEILLNSPDVVDWSLADSTFELTVIESDVVTQQA